MKFIFDNEEQKNMFMKAFSEKFDECPGLLGLNELSMSTGECTPETNKNCRKCWEQSGLEMEVIDEKVRKNEVYIIDIPNHMSCRCSINMGGKPYSLGTAVGKGETNTKVELMSREKWLAERIIALLEVIKFNVDHSIIISDKWVDELNSVSYDFNECIKEKENE